MKFNLILFFISIGITTHRGVPNHLKTAHSADQRDRTACLDAGSFERYLY